MNILDAPARQRPAPRSIDDVIRDGYEFNFGDYLSKMFTYFGKTWGYLIGHSGIMLGSYLVAYMIMAIFIFSSLTGSILSANSNHPEEFIYSMLSSMLYMFLLLLFYIVGWVLPFRAGTYTFLDKGIRTGSFDFGEFFAAMRGKWAKMMGLALITFLLTFGFLFAAYYFWLSNMIEVIEAYQTNPYNVNLSPFAILDGIGWIFLSYLPIIFFLVAASLSVPLLLFQTDNVIHAFVSSLKIVTLKWFHFFGLFIIIYIMTVAGIFVCGIGFLVTIHFFPLIIYCIYEDIFILQSKSEISEKTF